MNAAQPKIVVTDWTFRDLAIEEEILRRAGCHLLGRQCKTEAELIELVADAECVITQFAPLTPNVIQAMQTARAIVRYGIGVDNIDLEAATQKRIPVCNVPDYCIDEVADHTLALILALTRQIPQVSHRVREGGWSTTLELGKMTTLKRITVGVLGYGRIGREVVHRLLAFKSSVLVYDPMIEPSVIKAARGTPVSLDELLRSSDLITLHCPSTAQTRHLINRDTLGQMKRGVMLINVARGAIVQQEDLIAALHSGHVGGAGLDVADKEPIPNDNPLLKMENVIITNHIASCSVPAVLELRTRVAENAALAVSGKELQNVVNPEALRSGRG